MILRCTAVELEAFQTANIQRSQVSRAVVPHAQTTTTASRQDEKYMPSDLEKKLNTMADLLQSLVSEKAQQTTNQSRKVLNVWRIRTLAERLSGDRRCVS